MERQDYNWTNSDCDAAHDGAPGDSTLPVPYTPVAPPSVTDEAVNAYRFATIVSATLPDPVQTDRKA